ELANTKIKHRITKYSFRINYTFPITFKVDKFCFNLHSKYYKMALKSFVKISEVNNLSDARYCAGMTVDLMGFDLCKESEYFISPETFMELTGWVSGPEFVGEFGLSTEDNIRE